MIVRSRFEQDELIGISAIVLTGLIITIALYRMWKTERLDSDRYKSERDEYFTMLVKRGGS